MGRICTSGNPDTTQHGWRAALFIVLGVLFTTSVSGASRYNLAADYKPGERFMSIRLLGTLSIPDNPVSSIRVDELSGLAWDEDEQILYALSNRGKLFHLKPVFRDGQLQDVKVKAAFRLRTHWGRKLKKKHRDAEGLSLENGDNGKKGDSKLLISFERSPRIAWFNNKGYQEGSLTLPAPLNDATKYESKNHGLESVTINPKFGTITAPEVPLPGTRGTRLYSLSGKQWQIPDFPIPENAIVGMESIPDGDLLLLERAFSSVFSPVVISLHKIHLSEDCRISPGKKATKTCSDKTIAIFSSTKGWNVDNFEGLTRHRGNRYFIVSDNNRFWMQRTLLSYFEVLPEDQAAASESQADFPKDSSISEEIQSD